ncbi:MAG: hypothetical protein JXA25_00740 [Anaerolineales bacterium]|nr:hypothetical protein [Anaerolineales bacterium]
MKRITPILLLLLLSACASANAEPAADVPSLNTPAAPILTATSTPTATLSPTPGPRTEGTRAVVIQENVPPPTPTAITLPRALPDAHTQIFQPGPASFVTSPFRIIGRSGPTWNNRVVIDLVGEDGRLVSRTSTYLNALPGYIGPFAAEVEFEIESVSEQARLEVYTHSRRDGQVYRMASVEIFLLSTGRSLIHAAIDGPERLAIFSPRTDAVVSGGSVQVNGAGWVDSDLPLIIEVCDRMGDTIASTTTFMDSPGTGQTGVFSAEVSYAVEVSQPGRILVYEQSTDVPGFIHISGVDVWLKP